MAPGFLKTWGIPVLAGRDFEADWVVFLLPVARSQVRQVDAAGRVFEVPFELFYAYERLMEEDE